MANFKITATTTVAELKEQFHNEFGGILRVYQGRSEAPEDATLVSLGGKVGELECRASRTVGKFIEAFQSELGLKVKVYTKDNWVSVLDGITLATVREIPKNARKAQMKQYLAYQRDEEEDTADEKVVDKENTMSISPEELKLRKDFLEDGYDVAVRLHKISDVSALNASDIRDKIFIVRMKYDRGVRKEAYQYIESRNELNDRILKFKDSVTSYCEFCGMEVPPLEIYCFYPDAMVEEEVLSNFTSDIFVPRNYWRIYQGGDDDVEWPEMDTSIDEQIVKAINMENDFTMCWAVKFFINNEMIDMDDVYM